MTVIVPPGVFQPISDSHLLAEEVAARSGPGTRMLDLCTGSGVIALAAAEQGAIVDAVDISQKAVDAVESAARARGLAVRAHRGDLFEPVSGRGFDLIAANPPYVPHPDAIPPTDGLIRAWAAGPDGRGILDRLCDQVGAHLRPGGMVLLVQSSLVGEEATLDRLVASGLRHSEVIARRTGPLGPLMRRQREAGLVPADVVREDLLVIGGRA